MKVKMCLNEISTILPKIIIYFFNVVINCNLIVIVYVCNFVVNIFYESFFLFIVLIIIFQILLHLFYFFFFLIHYLKNNNICVAIIIAKSFYQLFFHTSMNFCIERTYFIRQKDIFSISLSMSYYFMSLNNIPSINK